MRKVVIAVVLGLLLTGCGNATQVEAQVQTTSAVETSAEQVSEAVSEEVADEETEAVSETESAEEQTTPEETEDSTEEVLKEVTEKVEVFEQTKIRYTTAAVNVRRGPSTDYEVVSHLKMAQEIETTGQAETGWYQIMLNGTPAYVSDKYLSETKVEIPDPTPVTPAPETPAETPAQPQTPTAAVAPAGVIMVGDSRCVQMQEAVGGGGCSWICENSKEYTWFSETAIPRFDQYVGKGTKVVINMGVNDPDHYLDYVALINAKAAEWAGRGAKTYLVSVNPVWENPYTAQEEVDMFNANVPGMLVGVKWIDTSSWLQANGYRLVDGLHYDAPTYVNIFNLIMGSL